MNLMDEIFWNDLLPRNYTFDKYNQCNFEKTFVYPIIFAILILFLRLIFEKLFAYPLARYLNIKELGPYKPDTILETYFDEKNPLTESQYIFLSKETGLDYNYLKKWFEIRKSLNKIPKIKKFSESFWKFFYYLSIWVYGLLILHEKSWFLNTEECWKGYPNHIITDDINLYYFLELSFYLSLAISHIFNLKNKYNFKMFLYYTCAITLIYISYLINFTRIGSIILFMHDTVEFWFEFVKMGKYANLKSKCLCSISYFILTISWFLIRLVIFPFKILHSTTYEAADNLGLFRLYYVINFLLYLLQIIHLIWFFRILSDAYKSIFRSKTNKIE